MNDTTVFEGGEYSGRVLRASFNKMMDGKVPTRNRIRCFACGTDAIVSAGPWRNGNLWVAISCQCISIQMDGVTPWDGWEVLRKEEEEDPPI